MARDGRNVDHLTAPLLLHHGKHRRDSVQHTADVHVDHLFHSSIFSASRGDGGITPALFTITSMRPCSRIHGAFATPVDVATLAGQAGMSVSTFHTHFKAVTGSPPLQYLKSIRLHRARLLMVQEGETAARAARLVGYQSASQFSREFKRFFGETPAADADKVNASLTRTA
jgi:AraC-like DNA-binding protein